MDLADFSLRFFHIEVPEKFVIDAKRRASLFTYNLSKDSVHSQLLSHSYALLKGSWRLSSGLVWADPALSVFLIPVISFPSSPDTAAQERRS